MDKKCLVKKNALILMTKIQKKVCKYILWESLKQKNCWISRSNIYAPYGLKQLFGMFSPLFVVGKFDDKILPAYMKNYRKNNIRSKN